MFKTNPNKTALVLSGGGARGAYQVGVLKGIAEILQELKMEHPFQILSGVSAGAINCVKLASEIENFQVAVEKLVYLWSKITVEDVFENKLISFGAFSGSLFGKGKRINSLLDTTPLGSLITKNCDFTKIKKNIDKELIESVIITANNYIEGKAISFIQTSTSNLTWKDSRREARLASLAPEHILASSAIPFLFPPVKIGSQYFGDGCVRNNTPCSPSIRMGADKLFVIGVRRNLKSSQQDEFVEISNEEPSLLRVMNTILNAVLLDAVEQDVYRINRINEMAQSVVIDEKKNKSGLKIIPALSIAPSGNIGELARGMAHHLPRLFRMSLSAFGSLDEASEIISYLLFHPQFCQKLIEMGYEDALTSRKEVIAFFTDSTEA